MGLRAFAIAVLVLIIGVAFQAAVPVMANERAFKAFIQEIKQAAQKDGIDTKHLKALDALIPDPEVQRLAARQPEYVKPIWAYLTHMVTQERLSLGRDQLKSRDAFLDGLEKKYGVPRGILIAIWGVETNYGGNKGSFSVLRSLATLGYEGKRADFGRQQLLYALRILQSGDVALKDFKGSWAGAMGHTQFIPTTYADYAADGTGDGIKDIWTEPRDALAEARIKNPKPVAYWADKGVRATGRELDETLGEVSIFAPAGLRGPVFMLTKNFRVLLRYNTAPAYALAVGHLSQRFFGAAPFNRAWPNADRPLLPDEIAELQRRLRKAGYDTGDIDGVLGRQTIAAVRRYQDDRGLAADGFATPGLLEVLSR